MCGNNSRGRSTLRPLRQAQGPQGLRDLLSTLLFFFTIIQAWCWTGAENQKTHEVYGMENSQTKINSKEIISYESVNKENVKTQIFEIRGYRVMFDKDIANYFGVTTGNLNKAMKRNIKRFPQSFCFQLSREEYFEILRFQFGILELDQGKYSKYLPYVYTEQGVAMLTSALHTDRAIEASIQIIEAFVEMTHYLKQNSLLLPNEELKSLTLKHYQLSEKVQKIEKNMVTRSELSDLIQLFDDNVKSEEVLILDGEPFKADVAYQSIYGKAKKNIIVIDDYIGIKTLNHLAKTKQGLLITIITDNKGSHPLKLSEYNDFLTEYPTKKISFIQACNKTHDRFIILDYGLSTMKIYHCGASSKDAGNKITTIAEIKRIDIYRTIIKGLLSNPILILK